MIIEMIEPPFIISSRWTPAHVERRDTELGTYEKVNSPVDTLVELHAQRALFKAPPSNLDLLWNQKRC